MDRRHPLRDVCSAAALLALSACSPQSENDSSLLLQSADDADVVFLVQPTVPDAMMQALFEGRVGIDAAGCLRLDDPDAHTVVWPHGYTVVAEAGRLQIRDAAGVGRGAIGGSFRISGGEVTSLEMVLSPQERLRAEQRCPGRYWIAGSVLAP